MFHELNFGGAKRAVMEFAKRLKKNHVVDLYYVDESRDNRIEDFFNNIYFYKFDSKIWQGNNWKIRLYKDTIELIKLYKLHKKISQDILSKKYDYIFVHPSRFTQAPFLLSILKNKCIYYCEEPLRIVYDSFVSSNIKSISFPKNLYEMLNRRTRKWIDLKNCKNAKIVLANSNFSKDFIKKAYGIEAKVCYLGVDANFFKSQNIKKSIDVLFVGNKKEYDLLNSSLKFFKTKPKVQAIFRDNGRLSISDRTLVEIYNKSKVLVALNKNEPFGLILLEAASCGVPVIAVDEGGYKESVIDSKTGFLTSRDPSEIYNRINKIIYHHKLWNKISKNARENILQNWTWDKSIERFLEIVKYEK